MWRAGKATLALAASLVMFCASAAYSQPSLGEFRFPAVGTEIVTSSDTFRVESVRGFDAVLRNQRTGATLGVADAARAW
jgi:hypothetical protein